MDENQNSPFGYKSLSLPIFCISKIDILILKKTIIHKIWQTKGQNTHISQLGAASC